MMIDRFPGIRVVALLIAYDNGIINRLTTQEEWLASLDSVLGADVVDEYDLEILDIWCMTLSPQEAETVACGEYSDQMRIIERSPRPELAGLFEDIFDA